MTARRRSLFGTQELAARIERAEAEFMASCSSQTETPGTRLPFAIPLAGGFATYAEPDSPFNKISGLGFDSLPDAAELEAVESAYRDRGSPAQVEIASLGDPGLGSVLTARGYRLVSFEHVLARRIDGQSEEIVARPGIEVRRSEDHPPKWLDVVIEGVLHPDTDGVAQHEEFPRHVLERAERAMMRAGSRVYTAYLGDTIAGGGGLRICGDVAQFTGAATAPRHRRRGVQTALVRARLDDAFAAGCEVAVVTTQPGSPSHANTQRMGFDLVYARAVLVREPAL